MAAPDLQLEKRLLDGIPSWEDNPADVLLVACGVTDDATLQSYRRKLADIQAACMDYCEQPGAEDLLDFLHKNERDFGGRDHYLFPEVIDRFVEGVEEPKITCLGMANLYYTLARGVGISLNYSIPNPIHVRLRLDSGELVDPLHDDGFDPGEEEREYAIPFRHVVSHLLLQRAQDHKDRNVQKVLSARAEHISPDSSYVNYEIAQFHLEARSLNNAKHYLLRAAQIETGWNPLIYISLFQVYHSLGDMPRAFTASLRARHELENLLRICPSEILFDIVRKTMEPDVAENLISAAIKGEL